MDITMILRGDNNKSILIPAYVLEYLRNFKAFVQDKELFIYDKSITAEFIHMVLVFYDTYVTRNGGLQAIENAIKNRSPKSDFYRMWRLLEQDPNKMIHLLWVAIYLGATELKNFLDDKLSKTMSDREIIYRLERIGKHALSFLSCDACRKNRAEYANDTKDRFFCSSACFNEYNM